MALHRKKKGQQGGESRRRHIAGFPHSLVVAGDAVSWEVEIGEAGSAAAFSVDIYEHGPHLHPERHLGYWTFPLTSLAGGGGGLRLVLDLYDGFPAKAVRLFFEGREMEPEDSWINPEPVIPPSLDIEMVLAGEAGEMERVFVGCFVHDRDILKAYYSREEHQAAYSDEANVFLQVFHRARVRMLRRFFARYFESDGRVLDVGSGYSMFRCMEREWPFEVTCCDLDEPALRVIEEEGGNYRCVACDAVEFPFGDGEYDGLFAGEILEHVVDPAGALKEWKRVVKPGGALIVTTPNAARLLNRVNRSRDAVNPEHISEMTYRELWALFREEGLRVMECRGIYLEFLFNYFRRGRKIDLLPARFNRPRLAFIFRAAMAAGNLARPFAYNLVFVLEKGGSRDMGGGKGLGRRRGGGEPGEAPRLQAGVRARERR